MLWAGFRRTLRRFRPTDGIEWRIAAKPDDERGDVVTRWVLDLNEIREVINMVGQKTPEMLRPMQLVCSTGMRRIRLVRLHAR